MFKSLYRSLATVLLGLFLLVGITLVLISVYSTGMYQQEAIQRLNRTLAGQIVSQKIIMQDGSINESALKEVFDMLMVINPGIEVYLLDPHGKILAFSAEPGKVKLKNVDLSPIETFLDPAAMLPVFGDDPRHPGGKKVFSAAPVSEGGRLSGYLYVILGGEIYDSVVEKLRGSYIFRLSMWAIISSIAVALITGLVIFACMTRRLRRLAAVMDTYAGGSPLDELDLLSAEKGHQADEIQMLVSTFREMAGRIEEQVESLKNMDNMRRELVANISHDLRTPIATLQGYIETLLMKDSSLSTEERLNYLDIAIKHCKRLSTLVSDLFELARLDAEEKILHCEPFSLGELVQDVVQKFQLTAQEKKVKIVTDLGEDLPFVSADIAPIERVFENLIENALRHTPEKGMVSVVLSPGPDRITVDVSDTGHGIPESDLPHIFDRYHQLDRSREGRSGHSGLGLAITKRILELHGSTINVKSRLQAGTTFTFSLPVYDAST